MHPSSVSRYSAWSLIVFSVITSHGLVTYAWITEDAFINFRVIENALAGFGLVWNNGERVQVFTSPLWLSTSLAISAITGEVIYSTIALSLLLTAGVFVALFFAAQKKAYVFLPCASLLMLSPSFRDYAISGLEPPMVCATFALLAYRFHKEPHNLRVIAILSSLCIATRHDASLLVLPFLAYAWMSSKKAVCSKIKDLILGHSPILAWTLFSLAYYGSPIPNTAFAKITHDAPSIEPTPQTLSYFAFLQHYDPLALFIISATLLVAFLTHSRARWIQLVGLALFVSYLFRIGGDYMSGRFVVAPLVLSIFILAEILARVRTVSWEIATGGKRTSPSLFSAALLLPNIALAICFLTPLNASTYSKPRIVDGIVDERSFYFSSTDLLTLLAGGVNHPFRITGESLLKYEGDKPGIVISCHIGMIGYFSGPQTHIIDALGLSDAFLARFPPRPGGLRVGHYERLIPKHYIASLLLARNEFSDPVTAQFFDDIAEATKHPLWSAQRFQAIWRLNSGYYNDHLRSVSIERLGGALLAEGALTFQEHSCLGGTELPVFRVKTEDLTQSRIRPITVNDL